MDVLHDPHRRRVLVRASGRLTIDEVVTLIRTARADVEYQMWPMLVDARSATTNASKQDIEEAVAAVRQAVERQGPRGHVAIVAADDLLHARLLLYEARCAEIGVHVIRTFRQLNDADRWLDIVSSARPIC